MYCSTASDLTRMPPHARARRGLARTWQSIELFDDLSVRENLLVASHRPSVWRTMLETVSTPDAHPEEIGAVLELLGLEDDRRRGAERALAGRAQARRDRAGRSSAGPRLVCLDEPAAGLDTRESEELGRRLRGLADGGQSMLLVDHDMGLVLGICDEVVVLEFGKVIARGAPDVVRQNQQVVAAYLGKAASELTSAGLAEGDRG